MTAGLVFDADGKPAFQDGKPLFATDPADCGCCGDGECCTIATDA